MPDRLNLSGLFSSSGGQHPARVTVPENCSFGEQGRSGFIEFRRAATLSILMFSQLTAGVVSYVANAV
jgi:hypothetical protein